MIPIVYYLGRVSQMGEGFVGAPQTKSIIGVAGGMALVGGMSYLYSKYKAIECCPMCKRPYDQLLGRTESTLSYKFSDAIITA